ncbi:MAG: CpsD/CapB family tyrosine-protein kinase, partial [Acidobacteria bacterium]|nr:CpsD/CapB family tyrosine-protein kinase [Acidobacteriota bacterium]
GGSDLVPLPIVDTEIPGLQLLPSGPLPPNPADLLDSERFLEVRREIENSRFDHVIFDSPPVLTVADPAILAGRVDAVLLVVWAGVTGRDALAHAVSRLKQVKGNLVGGVLNQLDLRQPMYYGYNYRPYLREPEDWKKEGARAAAFQQAVRPRQAPVS